VIYNKSYFKAFIGDKSFYKTALIIMVPVVFQELISTLFAAVNNVMVGQLSELSISAISVANRPALIFYGLFFGITGAASLMLSQYYGAKQYHQCQGIFILALGTGIVLALFFSAFLYFFPGYVMHIFVSDKSTVAIGVEYLQIIAFSYLPVAVTTTCLFSMRALGNTKQPMFVSMLTVVLNAVLNYIFIFGHLGMPKMGIQGAAWGTLLSRIIEMIIYLMIITQKKTVFSLRIRSVKELGKPILKSYIEKAIPLTINEILWTVGMAIFFWTYAQIDEGSLPAYAISDIIIQIGSSVSMGIASVVSFIIGVNLGAGEFHEAKENMKKLFALSLFVAMASIMFIFILIPWLPGVFNVAPDLESLTKKLAMLGAIFVIPNTLYGACFFCLRTGGDTRTAALLDSGYMWILPVPVAILISLFGKGHMGLLETLFIIQILTNAKLILAIRAVRKGKWIKNITLLG